MATNSGLLMAWQAREDLSETERDILEMLEEGRCTPAYVAEEIDRSQEYVRERLRELARLGIVDNVHRGLYELADEEREDGDVVETSERAPEPESDEREQLRELLSGEGDLLERRVDALLAMRDELRERGEAENDDLVAVVDPDEVRYENSDSVWSNIAKGTLGQLDGVESPPTGRSEWRWTGE